ncbi:helix-turn-helix domain-containing protein [Humidisolicoccus flavus]|uniref:helix-turn-helix domain-containing protein n=1 Tax=Humidisolicoccus flavus TaxID=3111414 RepID=UPI0032524298
MTVRSLASIVPENSVRFLGHDTHEHDEPHLIYVVSGRAHLTVDGIPMSLRRHEAVWLAPHVPHSVKLDDGGMVLGPLLDPQDSPGVPFRPIGAIPALVDLMTTLLGAAPNRDEQIEPFRTAIGRILSRAAKQYFAITAPSHPLVKALARESIRSMLTLEQLALKHRMSPRQVQRVFQDETGLPFARWRTRARLNSAIPFILSGGSLSTAARMAGYSSRAGLIRAISRETGNDPAELQSDAAGALSHHAVRPSE